VLFKSHDSFMSCCLLCQCLFLWFYYSNCINIYTRFLMVRYSTDFKIFGICPVNLTYPRNVQYKFCKSFLFRHHFAVQLLKNNRFLLASSFSLFLFWASLSLFLFTLGLDTVGNLIGPYVAMRVCYGTEAFGSHPPSERRIGIPNGSSL
jgi:hypothetical protein